MKVSKQENKEIALKVNGKKVKMNHFVSSILSNTVTAMVKSLRSVKGIRKIELKLVKKR